MYGYGFSMWLFWPVIIGLIAWLIFQNRDGGFGSDPMEILKRRYAKGDISKKEFESMKKDLQ